ncbi:uncharacterized protein LOC131155941 [Malania oleifera]|uniref:uncharacterized protein LOC131155941 n=1 Tax=Malania oleifera TaxID=397392 RepID=UPI0025ADB1AE|nr:uncharacterized protein LOC131155941 [Malania oleifera]
MELVKGNHQAFITSLVVQPTLREKIRTAQMKESELVEVIEGVQNGLKLDFNISDDGMLRFHTRIYISNDAEIKRYEKRDRPFHRTVPDMPAGLPLALHGLNAIWVVVDRLMKIAHFILIKTDGPLKRTIQILDYMLQVCVLDFSGNWIRYLPLVEFAYNNSYQASIEITPYEALYGRRCRSPLYWDEVSEQQILGPEFVQQAAEKVQVIKERIKTAQSR